MDIGRDVPATAVTGKLAQRTDQLRGVWNIVPTPFHPDEELDLDSLRTLTDFVIGHQVDGMTILGVLGEGAKLSDAERSVVIGTTVERAAGRLPVCVAVSAPSTVPNARASALPRTRCANSASETATSVFG